MAQVPYRGTRKPGALSVQLRVGDPVRTETTNTKTVSLRAVYDIPWSEFEKKLSPETTGFIIQANKAMDECLQVFGEFGVTAADPRTPITSNSSVTQPSRP